LKWHKDESTTSFYYEKLLPKGRIKPEDQEPENIEYFQYYINAFFELGTCRTDSGPIPFTYIVEFAKIYNEWEDFEDFLYLIRAMDNAYLDIINEERKKESGNK